MKVPIIISTGNKGISDINLGIIKEDFKWRVPIIGIQQNPTSSDLN